MPVNKKTQARGVAKPFNRPQAPAVQHKPSIVQLKTSVSPPIVKTPVAPPVYRPQPAPRCVQAKMPQPAQVKNHPVAPPVYRPQPQPKVLQTKTAAGRQAPATQPGSIHPAQIKRHVVAPLRVSLVVQRAESKKRKAAKDDDDEPYLPPEEMPREKQLRFGFLAATPENVTKAKSHQAVHYDESRYNAVYTCRACKRMIAYEDKKGEFKLTEYAYISKSDKRHDVRALALDHHPVKWSVKLKKLQKAKASMDEMRDAYQDESGLRPLCKVCNESHLYEYADVPDYRSDEDDDDFDPPRTPPHESVLNKGSFSGYRDPDWLKEYD